MLSINLYGCCFSWLLLPVVMRQVSVYLGCPGDGVELLRLALHGLLEVLLSP